MADGNGPIMADSTDDDFAPDFAARLQIRGKP